MARVFLALVALVGLMWLASWLGKATPEQRSRALKLIVLDLVFLSLCCIGVASCAIKLLSETFASPSSSRARFRAPLVA